MSSGCAVLMVGALEAGLWQHGRVVHYAADDAGRARLAQDAIGLSLRVLLDVVDEEFRREPLPGVGAGRARSLLAQRAFRLFPADARVACRPLDATEGQLCALPQPAVLDAWLPALQAAQTKLAGIHSVPMLGSALARHLGAGPMPMVLVFATRHGGLRQLLLDTKGVRVARLSSPGEAGDAAAIQHETSRFLRYLAETGAVDAPPPVHCVLPQAMHGALASFRCHALEAVFADALLAELLLRQPPSTDYASDAERASFMRHRRCERTWLATQGVAAAAAVFITCTAAATLQLRAEAARLSAAAGLLQEADAAPAGPARPLLGATEIAELERLARPSRAMQEALETVGTVLALHDGVKLQGLAWHSDNRLTCSFLLAAPPRQHPRKLGTLLEALRAEPLIQRVTEETSPAADDDSAPLDAAALFAGQASARTITLQFRAEAGRD